MFTKMTPKPLKYRSLHGLKRTMARAAFQPSRAILVARSCQKQRIVTPNQRYRRPYSGKPT
ncbi:hypothetical protein EBBID32_29080 [Sphingobium indicum BiD32]|uniref:Uncharacterized protein n=1 Tax=Sphingobium indicum BiD32 TaxID=1301087 RepID=N1MP85_9SPHN|nr:hypothetical protein EBBID32_29080 [Sphingobium indicum BiD32]